MLQQNISLELVHSVHCLLWSAPCSSLMPLLSASLIRITLPQLFAMQYPPSCCLSESSLLPGCTNAPGSSAPSRSTLCQRNIKVSHCSHILPDKSGDIKFSQHWHCCYCLAEPNPENISTPMDLATNSSMFRGVTCYLFHAGRDMHFQAWLQTSGFSRCALSQISQWVPERSESQPSVRLSPDVRCQLKYTPDSTWQGL